jgi:pimeloyl-ACP methyl ester carboxylesterase
MNTSYRFITFDFRGHGFNEMSEGEDLSQETLISDTLKVFEYIDKLFPEESLIVVGHSMGGSIATKSVAEILKNREKFKSLYDKIQGLIVIDVVEGTAMEALPYMENIVQTRKNRFKSIEDGIEYMVKSGTIKNLESARISVPPLLKEQKTKDGNTFYVWKTNLLASQKFWTGIYNYLSLKNGLMD